MLTQLRRIEVHMHINTTWRSNQALGIAHGGRDTADKFRMHAIHHFWVAGLADRDDLTVFDSDIAFNNTDNRINDGGITDEHIKRTIGAIVTCFQSHTIAQCFTTAVQALVARYRIIMLDLGEQRGITKTNCVAFGWAIHGGIVAPRHLCHQLRSAECRARSARPWGYWIPAFFAAGLCALEALFSCRLDCGRLTVVAGSTIGEAI